MCMTSLISYVTLFLTIEHLIILRIISEHPEWGTRKVDAEKLEYFYKMLNDSSAETASGAASAIAPTAASTSAGPSVLPLIAYKAAVLSHSSLLPATSTASTTNRGKIIKLRDHIAYGQRFW